jgi:site-specific recombinase XerD
MKYKFIARTRFNNPIDNNGFHDLLSRMLEKADIDKPLTIHQLRHTFASRALKAVVNINVVSQWLCHTDISTTYDTFIYVFKKEKEKALELLKAM